MRVAVIICCLGASVRAQPSLPREVLLLSQIKQKMRENLSRLPDYTCVETIARSQRPNSLAPFRPVDSLRVEVLHAGEREFYTWPNSRKVEESLGRLIGGGTTSSGEFALHARAVFVGDAQSKYVADEVIRARRTLRYDYVIPSLSSGMTLTYAGRSGRVSSRGSFWADAETLEVVRLEVNAEDIPADLPFASAVSTVDYGRVLTRGVNMLLPQSAEVTLSKASGATDRNEIHFSQCRGFGANSDIRFEEGASRENGFNLLPEKTIQELDLPAGISLILRLDQAIDSKTAVEGDPLTAHIQQAVRRDGRIIVPTSALVRGRIRRLESYDKPRRYFIVGLEFSEIEFDDKHVGFTGSLDRVDPVPELTWFLGSSSARQIRDVAGVTNIVERERIHTTELPGVGTFFVDGEHFRLPKDFHMIWRTVDSKKH